MNFFELHVKLHILFMHEYANQQLILEIIWNQNTRNILILYYLLTVHISFCFEVTAYNYSKEKEEKDLNVLLAFEKNFSHLWIILFLVCAILSSKKNSGQFQKEVQYLYAILTSSRRIKV